MASLRHHLSVNVVIKLGRRVSWCKECWEGRIPTGVCKKPVGDKINRLSLISCFQTYR